MLSLKCPEGVTPLGCRSRFRLPRRTAGAASTGFGFSSLLALNYPSRAPVLLANMGQLVSEQTLSLEG
jgi:hypothetical protein